MVLKFLTAGLIAAILAAAAVFYSLEAQNLRPQTVAPAVANDVTDRDTPPGTDHYRLETDEPTTSADRDRDRDRDETGVDTSDETRTSPGVRSDADLETFEILVDQAGELELVDMRDDAYLTLLDWALRDERYIEATDVAGRLSVPELRDTARQRIGISHAEAGRMSEAFKVLEQVEIDPLRDAIRLEIIRAATRD